MCHYEAEREQYQPHLVHVKIAVNALFLQAGHNLSQDVDVGLVNLENSSLNISALVLLR